MALSAIRSAIRGIRDRMHDDRRPQCLVTLSHFDEVLEVELGAINARRERTSSTLSASLQRNNVQRLEPSDPPAEWRPLDSTLTPTSSPDPDNPLLRSVRND